MRIYLTGTDNRESLLAIAGELQLLEHKVTTPYDVVDADWTEDANLLARLQTVLECEQVVTTSPNNGAWGAGADREVSVARAAKIPVVPAATLLLANAK